MAQNQMAENIHQLLNPLFWVSELSVFGFAWVAVILLWRFVPWNVRATSIVIFVLWSVAMTVTGVLREVRIFSELSAVAFLVIGLGVRGWLEERHAKSSLTVAELAHS